MKATTKELNFKDYIGEIDLFVDRAEKCREIYPEFEKLRVDIDDIPARVFYRLFNYYRKWVENQYSSPCDCKVDFEYWMPYDREIKKYKRSQDELIIFYFNIDTKDVTIECNSKKHREIKPEKDNYTEVEDENK